jgi:hypothetical protein
MGQGRPYKVFLNSKEISLENNFIHPQNIDSMFADKTSETAKILMYTKTKHWENKSLQELISDSYDHAYDSLFKDKSLITLFYVDNKLLENVSQVRFDKSYFCEITVKNLLDAKELIDCCRNVKIIDIKLINERPKAEIYIRGDKGYIPYREYRDWLIDQPTANTDGIFNRFVTVFANRARHVSWELSLGRESEAI